MVQLSGHDSKKYKAILRFKRQLREDITVSASEVKQNRNIDEFGELAVKNITQTQKRLTDEEINRLAVEYESGKTLLELAREYQCHRGTVSRVLKKHGVQVRGRGVRPPR